MIETSPVPYMDPGRTPAERLAFRLWRLRRDALRDRLRQGGVAVVEWQEGVPLAVGIEEAGAFRRHAFAGRG